MLKTFKKHEDFSLFKDKTVFKQLEKYIIEEQKDLFKKFLKDKNVDYAKAILEENNIVLACDNYSSKSNQIECYNISKFEDGLVYILSFIEFNIIEENDFIYVNVKIS